MTGNKEKALSALPTCSGDVENRPPCLREIETRKSGKRMRARYEN